MNAIVRIAGVALFISLIAGSPGNAQFWGGWGNWGGWGGQPQRQPQPRVPRPFNRFRTFFHSPHPQVARERQEPADYASAPGPQKKPDPSAANRVVVVGDGMADWLAYGLEETFAENPEFTILRRHRTTSGLIRYDPRRDVEWPQVIKELIAADKPKFIVMMIGINDRQPIRERAAAPARAPALVKPPRPEPLPADLELPAQQSAEQQNAERREDTESPPSSAEQRGAQGNVGPFEFHNQKWEAAYVKRIDATIAALKSAGVPVFWVSLPVQHNARASADSAYLNELYRQEAEKVHISYVDIWGGFVDEEGQYSPQGPDFEGQIRRLRSGDGVYFTKFGARKLAHYVEREILRALADRAAPVALPLEPQAAPGSNPAGPLAGPVVPLTVSTGAAEELLGSARGQPPSGADPVSARVLTRGEAIVPQRGRADDFSWPRSSEAAPAPSADAGQLPLLPAAKVSAGGSANGQIQAGAGAVDAPSGDPASDKRRNGLDATIGSSSDSRQTVGSSIRHSSTTAARRR